MATPTIHEEDEMEELDDESLSAIASLDAASSSSGAQHRTIRPATTVRQRIGRQTLVCTECKRLKLKCNRRTPCDQCTAKKRECKYDPGALTKIDVQSVHNEQIRHQLLLEAITQLLGVPEDEIQLIMNAPTYPPRPDYPGLSIDARQLRSKLGLDGVSISSISNGASNNANASSGIPRNGALAITDLFALAAAGKTAHLPQAIVTFSRAPPQIPCTSGGTTGTGTAPAPRRGQIPCAMVDLATRVFQANSIVVSHHVLGQLRLWQSVLGWEPRAANESAVPPVSAAAAGAGASEGEGVDTEDDDVEGERRTKGRSGKPDVGENNNAMLVTAPPSEIEYHDQPRPRDLSVTALAYEVFVKPALVAAQQQHQQHVGSGNTNTVSPSLPYSFSALGLGTSSPLAATFGQSPRSSSAASSAVSAGSALPLVTPQVVLRYLPSKAWRVAFMHEFDELMVTHDGVGISGGHSVLKKRIEMMFEWADGCMKRLGGGGVESDPNSGFSSSSSLASRGRRSGSTSAAPSTGRGVRGRSDGRGDQKSLPPPPTVGLFAVACAVYALGALSYASKSIHGTFPEDEDDAMDSGSQAPAGSTVGSSSTATAAGVGEMPPPSFVPVPGGSSSVNPHSINFAVSGDHTNGWAMSMGDLPGGRQTPMSGSSGSGSSSSAVPASPLNAHTNPLPDKSTPSNLLNLARAALLVHDQSALPHSLDYLHAHVLTWLYVLHPSDSASSVTSCGFGGASTGVGSGGMTVVEQDVVKELGKCVVVARGMGLDLVDRKVGGKLRAGGVFGLGGGAGAVNEEEEKGMGVWEKEMRRRVWWQLMIFDQQIADNLGTLPLIPPGTFACKPPSEADESAFGPTATVIPKPPEGAKGYNTTYFASKCQLLTIIKTLSFAQLEDGTTMDLARQLETRVANWKSTLPEQYKIDFREKPDDTSFPSLDTVDVQACDLHITANVFLLRLWLPFFNEALSSPAQTNHGVLLTATTAANAVILASHHLVTKYRAARPMSFGHYDFGNSVWFAAGILASVVTMKSDVIFSSTARRGVELAGALFKNQVVQGKSDSTYGRLPKYEVNKLMGHLMRLTAETPKDKRGTGSKRKSDATVGQMKMRYGVPIPYVGAAAMTTATDINLPQAQSALRPESAYGLWRSPPHQDSDELSNASVAPPIRPLRTQRSSTTMMDAAPASDSDRLPGGLRSVEDSSMFPESRPSSVMSHSYMSTSQTTSSSQQSGRSRPAVGVRRRPPPGSSPQSLGTPAGSLVDLPPDSKRSRAQSLAAGGGEQPTASSPHSATFPLSSSLPEAPIMSAPPSQPSTMRPPPIHQMSAPNPVFHQPRTPAGQQRHGSSPNVTIGEIEMGRLWEDFAAGMPGKQQQLPTAVSFPYYPQTQSRPSSAIITVDSRSQGSQHQFYGSPASAMSQPSLPVAHPPAEGYLSNLQATGGPPPFLRPEAFGQPGVSVQMGQPPHVGGFEMTGMIPVPGSHAAIPQNEGPAQSSTLIQGGQQYVGQSQTHHQHPQFAVGPITEATWTNVAAPQNHGVPAQGWPQGDPNTMHYMGSHHP